MTPGPSQRSARSAPLAIGTKTPHGEVAAVGFLRGERYYWLWTGKTDPASPRRDKRASAMHPASIIEASVR